MKNTYQFIILFYISFCFAVAASAQNLPKVQTQSVLLPKSFRIDGIVSEWDNKFQCYNKNVALYCTVANDQEHLYLAVRAIDPIIIKKMIAGGIQFTVCKSGERSEENPFTVTYPSIAFQPQSNLYRGINDFKKSNRKDSLIRDLNKTLISANKVIRLKGGEATADSVSIYNKLGIKTAAHFDDNLSFTCEILLPLKLVGIKALKSPIAYNIMLRGSSVIKSFTVGKVTVTDVPIGMSDDATFSVLNFPTDFWSRCTLTDY
ncbi:hypothetical protein [Mucilaginibacter jinjuensis]|uniref:Uncharacterized protein n=1 Tax=Mucilaginibacter jinjuensis TaxID=1176721 RepID=A0ABY7TC08_9SPHI|nr:hypothetical protein [Mucilaginibacter jinjuensis]WCT13774.1 hypothetical protein PQO05_07480 [Mucilaginibacter jinjuensis]